MADQNRHHQERTEDFLHAGTRKAPQRNWLQIAEEFPEADVRDLQRELARYTPHIIADISSELAGRLDRSSRAKVTCG